jgi:hypothetical protein
MYPIHSVMEDRADVYAKDNIDLYISVTRAQCYKNYEGNLQKFVISLFLSLTRLSGAYLSEALTKCSLIG